MGFRRCPGDKCRESARRSQTMVTLIDFCGNTVENQINNPWMIILLTSTHFHRICQLIVKCTELTVSRQFDHFILLFDVHNYTKLLFSKKKEFQSHCTTGTMIILAAIHLTNPYIHFKSLYIHKSAQLIKTPLPRSSLFSIGDAVVALLSIPLQITRRVAGGITRFLSLPLQIVTSILRRARGLIGIPFQRVARIRHCILRLVLHHTKDRQISAIRDSRSKNASQSSSKLYIPHCKRSRG